MNLKTMYDYFLKSDLKEQPFLTSNDNNWWADYVANHAKYDRYFVRMYSSFEYYSQPDIPDCFLTDNDIKSIINDFRADVTSILSMNAEKYRQLYRVLSVPDTENELFENVNGTTTTITKYGKQTIHDNATRNETHTTMHEAYTDNTENNSEPTEDNNTHRVSPYDSVEFADDNNDTIKTGARKQKIKNDYGKQEGAVKDIYDAFVNTDKDTGEDRIEEKRHGNIGVTTVSQMLRQHVDFWESMKYMQTIFSDISNELLLVG